MQELIRIKENSFCVIRVLSGKFMYIRLHFHFLNAKVIISNATFKIFSSYLLNCTLSTLSQVISLGRQPGSSLTYRHTTGGKDAKGTPLRQKGSQSVYVSSGLHKKEQILDNNKQL